MLQQTMSPDQFEGHDKCGNPDEQFEKRVKAKGTNAEAAAIAAQRSSGQP